MLGKGTVYSDILHWNDILSSVYLPLFVMYLYHNSLLLSIGRFDTIHYVLILATLEFTKYIFYLRQTKMFGNKLQLKDFVMKFLAIILLFVLIYIIAVLFGAPAFSNHEETCMFSLLVTTLIVFPTCLYFGADVTIAMFLSVTLPEESEVKKLFMLKVRLTLFGAWLGALVIPLDWNRSWQDWPIPCSTGAILGYTVAVWLSTFLQYCVHSKLSKKTGKYVL